MLKLLWINKLVTKLKVIFLIGKKILAKALISYYIILLNLWHIYTNDNSKYNI